jgi:putative transposase
MSHKRWKVSSTSVSNIGYHLIWCPKYRRNVLTEGIASRLKELLKTKAKEIGRSIEEIEVMPDHGPLFVKAKPSAAPHWIVPQLKGDPSRHLRQEYAAIKSKLPTRWTRSCHCESVGPISEMRIRKYIEDQQGQ